jgi:pimeloyl-ACP methyl ester carboxylesterase
MNDGSSTKDRAPVRRGWIKWVLLIIVVVVALPLALLAIGFLYQTIASQSDGDRYPPPGELVDIGGYRLHLHCTGERKADQPLVVIEAGSGSSSPDWVLVQPEIAEFARVCTYDRAGLGWSDPGPQPRSSQQYASELHALLEAAGEEPPFLLVAHSLGAHTVRIYTDEHPEDVVGMVLVDARLPSGDMPSNEMSTGQLALWEFLARCGFFRLMGKQAMQVQAPAIAAKIPDYPYPIVWSPIYFETNRLETMTVSESDKRARETGPFADLPLVVITSDTSGLFSQLPPDEMEAAEERFRAGQQDLADLSTNGQFLIAEGSGHNIPVENPEIIVATVREMMREYQ